MSVFFARKVGGPVSIKKGWDALYSLTVSLYCCYYPTRYLIVLRKIKVKSLIIIVKCLMLFDVN